MNEELNLTTKEEYLVNPCKILSITYWKHLSFKQPGNIEIYHEKRLFKIIHIVT